jgi:hypothetical protein
MLYKNIPIEDYDLWFRMICSDYLIANIDIICVHIRKHKNNISKQNTNLIYVQQLIQQYFHDFLHMNISEIQMNGLIKPTTLLTLGDIESTYNLLLEYEQYINRRSFSIDDRNWIENDLNARLGELVTHGMRIDHLSSKRLLMKWIARGNATKVLLTKLLQK